MKACIINPSNVLHWPRSAVFSLKMKMSSVQLFKRIIHTEISVLEKAGCIVTRFMLYCTIDLSKGMPPIFKHILEFVADPEVPSKGLFPPSSLTLIWHSFNLHHILIAFENRKDGVISLYGALLLLSQFMAE